MPQWGRNKSRQDDGDKLGLLQRTSIRTRFGENSAMSFDQIRTVLGMTATGAVMMWSSPVPDPAVQRVVLG